MVCLYKYPKHHEKGRFQPCKFTSRIHPEVGVQYFCRVLAGLESFGPCSENARLQDQSKMLRLHRTIQGWFYAANWQILANFDKYFVIPEISVNQVKKMFVFMLGGGGYEVLTPQDGPFKIKNCPTKLPHRPLY